MKFIKISAIVLASILLLSVLASCKSNNPGKIKKSSDTIGLYVSEGKLMHKGKEFRGVGVNFFAAYYDLFKNPLDDRYQDGFKTLKDYEIPFARINMGMYYPAELRRWQENSDFTYVMMDELVREATKNDIGLICSIFWNYYAFPDLAGEPISAIGDVNSKTWTLMRQYLTDIVTRFKDNPTIWAWEFGNEYNLAADIPVELSPYPELWAESERTARDDQDKLSSADVVAAMNEFAKIVRSIDPDRLITTGNADIRSFSWNLSNSGSLSQDSSENSREFFNYINPYSFDCTSIHIYKEDMRRVSPFDSIKGAIQLAMEESEKSGRVLFLGEFGYPDNADSFPDDPVEMFNLQMEAIEELNVPLSAVWRFEVLGDDLNFEINPARNQKRAYQLEAIRDLNRRLNAN